MSFQHTVIYVFYSFVGRVTGKMEHFQVESLEGLLGSEASCIVLILFSYEMITTHIHSYPLRHVAFRAAI